MSRNGFSVYRRKDRHGWAVAYVDGTGRRRVIHNVKTRAIAVEIGKAKAAEADRVRSGIADIADINIAAAGRKGVAVHLDAWKKAMTKQGNTAAYVAKSRRRVERLLETAAVPRLLDITADRIQSALGTIAEESTPQTARHYLTSLKIFIRWCLRSDRLLKDPTLAVKRPNVAGESFRRRAFTDGELSALLTVVEGRRTSHSVSGQDRAMFYRLMAYTGLRVSEARSLTPESFALEGDQATVTVAAGYSKHRREDVLLLRADFAALLKPWLAFRQPGHGVFEFSQWSNMNRVFERDCKAAGIVAAAGEIVGMHSLRRFFITRAVRAGGLAAAQDLARHSTPVLTKKYTDLVVTDHLKGLEGLPALKPSKTKTGGQSNVG